MPAVCGGGWRFFAREPMFFARCNKERGAAKGAAQQRVRRGLPVSDLKGTRSPCVTLSRAAAQPPRSNRRRKSRRFRQQVAMGIRPYAADCGALVLPLASKVKLRAPSNGSLLRRARAVCSLYCQTNCIKLSRNFAKDFSARLRSVIGS